MKTLNFSALYCEDPQTGLHYPINSTWPSTTFCGTYTCHATVDEENGNFIKVPKIVPYINEAEEKENKEKEDDKEILENGSEDFGSMEKENRQSHEISDSDWDENEFGKLYELYKIASDLGESIKKAESELKRRDGGTEKNANQIEKEYKKLPITNTDNSCKEHKNYHHQSNGENHIQSDSNPPQVHSEQMTADMYTDYNKYLNEYYSQYPNYNYQYDHYTQTSDAETSPSNTENSYTGYAYPESYGSNYTQYYSEQDYYNYWYAYMAENYPEYYSAEGPKLKAPTESSHVNVDQSQNQTQADQLSKDKHHHHHDDQTKESPKVDNHPQPQVQNLPSDEVKNTNSSDYETEYHTFYHDFISKYPNSTAYSSKPTDEDTKHFYSVYYERFPHKRPVATEATAVEEVPEHNHDTQNREGLAKQKEAIVLGEEREKSQNANTPEFKTTGKDFDKEGALEELQNWADYRHPKETIQWKANPFDAAQDKDVYLTTSRHPGSEIAPGKYDWINSKLGQFGVPLPAKPYRSPNLNPLLSSVLLQPKFRSVLRRLPGVHHHPHLMRRKRSPRTKTFVTVKG